MSISVLKLYYIICFTLSLGVVISFSLQSGVRLYFYDLPIFLIAPISIFYFWKSKRTIENVKYLLLFLAAGFAGLFFFLSTFSELLVAGAYLVRFILYVLLALPIFSFSKKEILKLYKAVIVSGLLFLAIGYIQYFFYTDLANLYYLGWDRHLHRFFSSFLDPNFAGVYLVFLLVISISFISFSKNEHRKKTILLLLLLYMPAIFLTYSRTAYVSLVISMSVFLFNVKKKYVIGFLILFVFMLIIVPKNFGGEGVNLLRTYSIFTRLEASEVALSIFLRNPILGVGFNAFKYAQLKEGVLLPSQLNSHAASGVPNSYMFVLATTGIIGFSLFLVFLSQIIKKLSKGAHDNLIVNGSLAAFIGVLVSGFFENTLFYSPILIVTIIVTSLVLRLKQLSN